MKISTTSRQVELGTFASSIFYYSRWRRRILTISRRCEGHILQVQITRKIRVKFEPIRARSPATVRPSDRPNRFDPLRIDLLMTLQVEVKLVGGSYIREF